MKYYNRSIKDLNSLKSGDQLLIRKDMCTPLQPFLQKLSILDRPK